MTLTVCVGASGSGKTTFLNDVHKSHKCTYIRQYHNLRPYIKVSTIPDFDPTELPYWDIYVREEKDQSIIVGGTMAGQFMAGLSGGQRKLLLFELIVQRTASQENLLIVLDEPFAGVTDDFIPFIVKRLEEMRIKHNVLLVTNDHVETLKNMADNTITVSAIKRNEVKVNGKEGVERDLALLAMSIGDDYKGGTGNQDLEFFRRVELSKNGGIVEIAAFTAFLFGLFLLTFWDSKPGSEALVLIAGGLVTYFSIQPYFLQLGDWRVFMTEEAEALLHSSKSMNKLLKSSLTLFLLVAATCVQFGCQAAVIKTITTPEIFVGILFNNFADFVLMLLLGLYTDLPFHLIEIYGAMPFLFMIFFSTTFSPGAGVPGLKELRYLFPRYYMWCMLPEGAVTMEGCPESHLPLYLVLSALLVPITFSLYKATNALYKKFNFEKKELTQRGSMTSYEFAELQMELFGAKALENLKRIGSTHDLSSIEASIAKSKLNLTEHTKRASEDGQEYDDFVTILNKSDTGSPNAEAGDDRV
jgi:ABC-type lipoprotein export system ATPase subunit